MDNSKNAITLIGAGIGIGVVLTLIAILFFGARPTNVHLGPVEFEIPTATAQAYQATVSALQTQVGRQQQPSQVTLPVQSAQPTQASTSQLAVQPTAVQFPSKSQRLSIDDSTAKTELYQPKIRQRHSPRASKNRWTG